MARTFITAPMLLMLAVITASAQSQVDDLRTRLEPRFEIVPIANGIVLTPRFKTSIKSVEVSDSTIAIDGAPVTGRELRERLGNDADLVLQVSYLDAAARRSLAAGKTSPPKAVETAPTIDPGPMEPQAPRTPRARRREDIVRIGGSVTVDSDEFVRGDVVVVGGSASINGEVDGEVVVVGGSARFGPQADVRGDITVIGGGLSRDPGAVIRGAINEVGFGGIPWRGEWGRHAELGLDERHLSRRAIDRHARAHHAAVSFDDSGSVRRQNTRRTDRRPRRGRSGKVVVRRLPRGNAVHPRTHHDGVRPRNLNHRYPAARAAARRNCRAARRHACRVHRRGLSHRPAAAGQGGCVCARVHTQRRSSVFS